jgi:putative oxidoreductase
MFPFAHRLADRLDRLADPLLPTLARLVFAGVLAVYFWASALTKLGDGFFGFLSPSVGAYAQIFPKSFEAVGYDASQMSWFQWLVVVAGTWAEFILPALILLGLLTRLASLGMIGFIIVQSVVDITGHGADAATIGAWFDRPSGAIILDQRALWLLCLAIPLLKGAGPISLDRLLFSRPQTP